MLFHLICMENACSKKKLLFPFYQGESKSLMQLKARVKWVNIGVKLIITTPSPAFFPFTNLNYSLLNHYSHFIQTVWNTFCI